MIDVLRLLAILGAVALAAGLVQRAWDARRRRSWDRATMALGLSPIDIREVADVRRAFPFLTTYEPAEVRSIWQGSPGGAETVAVVVAPPSGPFLGYTLLARRVAGWSARAVLRPPDLVGGPEEGRDPDPRRAEQLRGPELAAALGRAGAWLHIEGPWRVVGSPGTAVTPTVGRLSELLDALPALAPEPDEFAGGLEWNV